MLTIKNIDNCCGCRACEQICPKKCIKFVEDSEGFLVPKIDKKECIECGLCYKKCPQNRYEKLNAVKKTYAALHNDKNTLMNSTSGGGMSSIAEIIIKNNGIVYGASLDPDDWKVKFIGIEKIEDLHYIRGSKYVQSDTGNTYSKIKNDLKNNRDVLFIGVPCQVAGLYSYLGNIDLKHLFTIDILCHGTPSPQLFIKHIRYLEKKFKKKMVNFSFRDKSKFPNKTALKYDFGKKYVILGKCEPYFQAFITGSAYRYSCYDCHYARNKRVGDITLGDFWGIKKYHKNFDNSNGVSLVLINTEKGINLIKQANLTLVESNLDYAMDGNGILKNPSEKSKCREHFYSDIDKIGYEKALKKNIKTKPLIYNYILTHLPKKIVKFFSQIK